MQNIISFSYLYDILRKEKVNNGLTKLEYDLFDNIEDYLKIKKEILQNAKNSNNNKKIEQIEEELKKRKVKEKTESQQHNGSDKEKRKRKKERTRTRTRQ